MGKIKIGDKIKFETKELKGFGRIIEIDPNGERNVILNEIDKFIAKDTELEKVEPYFADTKAQDVEEVDLDIVLDNNEPLLHYECKDCKFLFKEPLCLTSFPPKDVCPRCHSKNIELIFKSEPQQSEEDVINKPKHYNIGEIETIKYIEDVLSNATHLDAHEGYLLGNVIKYTGTRLGVKDKLTKDAGKAKYYLTELIEYQKRK